MKRVFTILITMAVLIAMIFISGCETVVYNNYNFSTAIEIDDFGVPSKVHRIGDTLYVLDKIQGIYSIDLLANKAAMFTNYPELTIDVTLSSLTNTVQILNSPSTQHRAPYLWYDRTDDSNNDYRLYPIDFGFTSDNLYMFAIVKATLSIKNGSESGELPTSLTSEERFYILRVELADFTGFSPADDLYPLNAAPINSSDWTEPTWDSEIGQRSYNMYVTNQAVYLSDYYKSLRVILLENDADHNFHPQIAFDASGDRIVISKRDTFSPGKITAKGSHVFLAERQSSERGIDVYKYDPTVFDTTPDAYSNKFTSLGYYPYDMAVDGNYLYCAIPTGIRVFDINVPFSIESLEPQPYRQINLGSFTNLSVRIAGSTAYCAYGNGVIVVPDILDMTSGTIVQKFLIKGWVTDTIGYNDGSSNFIISPSQTVKTSSEESKFGSLFIHKLN